MRYPGRIRRSQVTSGLGVIMVATMSMSRQHVESPPFDEALAARRAREAVEGQRWREARELYLALACNAPGVAHYRAALAYVRGQEAHEQGELEHAREHWRRTLIIEPAHRAAALALSRHARPSWVGRLFTRHPHGG